MAAAEIFWLHFLKNRSLVQSFFEISGCTPEILLSSAQEFGHIISCFYQIALKFSRVDSPSV